MILKESMTKTKASPKTVPVLTYKQTQKSENLQESYCQQLAIKNYQEMNGHQAEQFFALLWERFLLQELNLNTYGLLSDNLAHVALAKNYAEVAGMALSAADLPYYLKHGNEKYYLSSIEGIFQLYQQIKTKHQQLVKLPNGSRTPSKPRFQK